MALFRAWLIGLSFWRFLALYVAMQYLMSPLYHFTIINAGFFIKAERVLPLSELTKQSARLLTLYKYQTGKFNLHRKYFSVGINTQKCQIISQNLWQTKWSCSQKVFLSNRKTSPMVKPCNNLVIQIMLCKKFSCSKTIKIPRFPLFSWKKSQDVLFTEKKTEKTLQMSKADLFRPISKIKTYSNIYIC